MPFQPGNKYGHGRPKKKLTIIKDFVKANPYAVETLMQVLYDQGIEGDRESAIYIIDRIKGKPKQQADISLEGGELLGSGVIVQLLQFIAKKKQEELIEPPIFKPSEIPEGETRLIEAHQDAKIEAGNKEE